jgi:phosphoserine phosphatase RsbU/P
VLATGDPGRSSEVTLLLAGHPYPLVLGADGDIREVGTPNVPVGMFTGATYETSSATAPAGSTLLLFSDGVTDVRRPDGTFHHELLEEVLRKAAGLDPEGIAEHVEAAAVAHQGGRPHDDIAIMALSARRPAAP